jgi:hypothetical protein
VRIVHGRWHGWIDLLAFNPRTGTLIVIELKTRIDDFGAIERNLRWHEQSALAAALELGWQPRRVFTWLLVLASAEVDDALRLGRDTTRLQFPVRAGSMARIVAGEALEAPTGWGLAMIDPSSRRRDWLIMTRLDGRRTALPYSDYGDAARRLAR